MAGVTHFYGLSGFILHVANFFPFPFVPNRGMDYFETQEFRERRTFSCGLTKTLLSLFRGILSIRNFDGKLATLLNITSLTKGTVFQYVP